VEEENMSQTRKIAQPLKLSLPKPNTADRGSVRLGDAAITGKYPVLRLPSSKTADSGNVRLGVAAITGRYPT
jgi:hypothetical protein